MKIKHVVLMIVLCGTPAPALAQEAPSARIFELDKVHTAPILLNPDAFAAARDSLYPAERRRRSRTASVEMSFIVGPDGVPDSIRTVRSTDRAYNPASVASIGLLRFRPATVDGEPVAVRVQIVMGWTGYVPPSERHITWRRLVYGARSQTSSGEPIYLPHDVQAFSRLPDQLNREEAAAEAARQSRDLAERFGADPAALWVVAVVNGDGEVVAARILDSTNPIYEEAALSTVRVLRWQPIQMFGGPVHMAVVVPIEWGLR